LNNLLSNALKFTSIEGAASVNTNFINSQLILEIKDTGIGIHKDEIEFVYKQFYQVKNDITKSQSSGIGLGFTKNIIEAHHFSINLNSIYGEGTNFSVLIPMAYTKPYNDTLNTQKLIIPKVTEITNSVFPKEPF
jgi:signal transduction histidine kinase